MIIENILAHYESISSFDTYKRDEVSFEWYELNKKVMRKTSLKGIDIGFRLSHDSKPLRDGDIVSAENGRVTLIRVNLCQCIEIHYHNAFELAKLCYEIGNRHAPLFFPETEGESFLIPYDAPLLDVLTKMNFHAKVREGLLIHPLSSNISAHSH